MDITKNNYYKKYYALHAIGDSDTETPLGEFYVQIKENHSLVVNTKREECSILKFFFKLFNSFYPC